MERETLMKEAEVSIRVALYYIRNSITKENVQISIDGAHIKTKNTVHFDIFGFLKENGCRVYVATSKPEHMAVHILEHFGLSKYFDLICGATMDTSRTEKSQVIAYLLGLTGSAENAIMVGDTKFDVIGAAAHNIPTVGVSWGYGTVEDMQNAGAVAIANTMQELLEYLTK